jgi:cytochrome P450
MLLYGAFPRRFCALNAARYGRSYTLSVGGAPVLVTADPEHVRRIFAAESDVFRSFAEYSLRALFGPRSVLVTHGAAHQKQRKLLGPPLGGARLRSYGPAMEALAQAQLAGVRAGAELSSHALALRFTLDVIVRTVFGLTDAAESETLRALLTELVHALPPSAIFAPQLQQPWFPPWARYLRAQQRFDAWLAPAIRLRRGRPRQGDDVLSLLLEARYDDGNPLEDAEVRDQLVTLLLAGHETTALTLTRCLERLHANPDVLARVRAELDGAGPGPEAVQRLPYLSAVLDETLRVDPIVTDVARVAKQEVPLGNGLVLAPREGVLVMIEALHFDPLLYPEPTRFRPERFLERKYGAHEYAPFGGGVRRCLGAAFSDYESKIFLAMLLRRHRLAPLRPGISRRVRRNLTMGPAHDVPLRVLS